jgi:type IV pilus assembly protein PilX
MHKLTKSLPRGQQGVVLFISLIVLVAMSLAGIALMRSVDTATLVAGNLAFKQSSLQSSHLAVSSAVNWLGSSSAGTGLYFNNTSQGYFSSVPASEPDWFNKDTWDLGDVGKVNGGTPDAAGNKVRYMIHRLCTEPNVAHNGSGASGQINQCARFYPVSAGLGAGSKGDANFQFPGPPEIYYRLTVRVDGPRNTVSITQVSLLIPTS